MTDGQTDGNGLASTVVGIAYAPCNNSCKKYEHIIRAYSLFMIDCLIYDRQASFAPESILARTRHPAPLFPCRNGLHSFHAQKCRRLACIGNGGLYVINAKNFSV